MPIPVPVLPDRVHEPTEPIRSASVRVNEREIACRVISRGNSGLGQEPFGAASYQNRFTVAVLILDEFDGIAERGECRGGTARQDDAIEKHRRHRLEGRIGLEVPFVRAWTFAESHRQEPRYRSGAGEALVHHGHLIGIETFREQDGNLPSAGPVSPGRAVKERASDFVTSGFAGSRILGMDAGTGIPSPSATCRASSGATFASMETVRSRMAGTRTLVSSKRNARMMCAFSTGD